MTAGDLEKLINGLAPFELAEDYDNVGLLAGKRGQAVHTVLCALDLSEAVLEEAKAKQADLILTHHPILFRGRKNLCEDDVEGRLLCELIRGHFALIAAHTNFDNAENGVNDALAKELALQQLECFPHGMRIGQPRQKTLGEFCEFAHKALGDVVRCYGKADTQIRRVAVLGGAGGGFATEGFSTSFNRPTQ